MTKILNGKTVIVTGASRGIGVAIAQKMGSLGANVVVNFSSQQGPADETVELVKKVGGKAIAIKADVSKSDNVKQLFDRSISKFGGVDILINNAGVILYKLHAEVTEEEYDRLFDINVKGTFLTCREAAKRMNNNGRIINFSTGVTRMMLPTYGIYAATKGAVEQLTRSLAKELGPKGITVNTVSPGPTNTALFREGKTPERIQQMAAMSAFNRIAEPEDIANAVSLLVGDDAKWITGQNIVANGGVI